MAGPADWRNTSIMAKFLVVDARACIPFVILLYQPSWAKVGIAVFACVFFAVLSYFSYTLEVMFRRIRSRIAGPVKAGVAWWHRPQRNLYSHKND